MANVESIVEEKPVQAKQVDREKVTISTLTRI